MNWFHVSGTNSTWAVVGTGSSGGTLSTPAGFWLNGETAATLNATSAGTITIDQGSHISTYGLTLNGSNTYTFTGTGTGSGRLVITGGGINAATTVPSVTFTANTSLVVGSPQTWNVPSTLTVNGPVNLNISTLTIDGSGTTNLNGVVSDCTDSVANPEFNGLLTGYNGSLVKNGSGTLNLNNAANTFKGSLTVNAGVLGTPINTNTLANNTLIWNGGTVNLTGGSLSP